MKNFTPGLFPVSAKQIAMLIQRSEVTGRRRLSELREALGKSDKQPVFLDEFCRLFGYPLREACIFFGISEQ